MESLMRQLPLRVTLTLLVISLVALLLVVILWQLAFVYQPNTRTALTYSHANLMGDRLLEAAAEYAKERGMTAVHLGLLARGSSDAEVLDKIHAARRLADKALQRALAQGEQLIADHGLAEPLQANISHVQSALQRVQLARQRVDRSSPASADIQPAYWLGTLNTLIERITLLRNLSFLPTTPLESAAFKNIHLKQTIWLACEYAAREQALVAMALTERKPLSAASARELVAYRDTLDRQMTYLREVGLPVLQSAHNPEIESAWERLQTDFVLGFGAIRADVLTQVAQGHYPLSERQWLEAATAGIDSLLAFSQAISTSASADTERASRAAKYDYQLSIGLLIGMLGMTAVLLLLGYLQVRRLCHLVRQLRQTARDYDLRQQLDEAGRDELALLGHTFNVMQSRFTTLLQAVHDATREIDHDTTRSATAIACLEKGLQQQQALLITLADGLTQIVSLERELVEHASDTAAAATRNATQARLGLALLGKTIAGLQRMSAAGDQAVDFLDRLQSDSRALEQAAQRLAGDAQKPVGNAGAAYPTHPTAAFAEDIRRLITQMRQQIEHLGTALLASQHEADGVLEQNGDVTAVLEHIAQEAGKVSQASQRISEVAQEPLSVTEEMYRYLSRMKQIATGQSDNARLTGKALQDIGHQMDDLDAQAGRFHIQRP